MRRLLLTTLPALVVLSGCGTLENLGNTYTGGDTPIYKGTRPYGTSIDHRGNFAMTASPYAVILLPMMPVDWALSLVADTATLPYTIPYHYYFKTKMEKYEGHYVAAGEGSSAYYVELKSTGDFSFVKYENGEQRSGGKYRFDDVNSIILRASESYGLFRINSEATAMTYEGVWSWYSRYKDTFYGIKRGVIFRKVEFQGDPYKEEDGLHRKLTMFNEKYNDCVTGERNSRSVSYYLSSCLNHLNPD